LDTALHGGCDCVDAMAVNDRICLNIASIGIDACTAYYANRHRFLRGQFGYIAGLFQAFFVAKLPAFAFSIDGGPTKHASCTLAAFANGQYYGGIFRPVPIARNNDGILDVLFVDKLSRLRMLPLIVGYAKGKHVDWDVCHFYRCQNIRIDAEKPPIVLNIDGEIMTVDSLDIRLLPHSVRIAVPKKESEPHAV